MYSVSWASLELIIYVFQAGLKVLSVLLSQSLKWWDYPAVNHHTVLIWTWNPQTISRLIIWRCELQVYSEEKPKTKDPQQSPNRTPQIKTSKYLEEQELKYQRRNNFLISKAPNLNLLLIYTFLQMNISFTWIFKGYHWSQKSFWLWYRHTHSILHLLRTYYCRQALLGTDGKQRHAPCPKLEAKS